MHLLSVKPEATDCVSPSKLYGILASGTPVIALIDADSSHARLIQAERVGAVCDVTAADGGTGRLVAAIEELSDAPELIEEMGLRARQLAEQQFDRRGLTGRFAAILQQVLGGLPADAGGGPDERGAGPDTATPPLLCGGGGAGLRHMRVLVNGLSIGSLSGAHVVYGFLSQVTRWTARRA